MGTGGQTAEAPRGIEGLGWDAADDWKRCKPLLRLIFLRERSGYFPLTPLGGLSILRPLFVGVCGSSDAH